MEDYLEQIRNIATLPTKDRARALEELLGDMSPLVDKFARRLKSRYGYKVGTFEDVQALVLEQLWLAMRELVDNPGALDRLKSFVYWARKRVERTAYHQVEDAQPRGMTSATTVVRRQRELRRTADLLSREGVYNVRSEDLVRFTNERLQATLANPTKQGMVCTIDDLVPLYGGVDVTEGDTAPDTSTDFLIHETEGETIVRETLALANAQGGIVSRVANLWLGPYLLRSGHPDVPELKQQLHDEGINLTVTAVREAVNEVKQIAVNRVRELLPDYLDDQSNNDPAA